MVDVVVLEWTFSPPDYFEEPIHIARDDYEMTIGKGTVEARISPGVFAKRPRMRDQLHNFLNDRFLGVMLLTYKPYALSQASMYRLHPDGRKDTTVFLESAAVTVTMGTPDIVVTDRNGNVISDSRQQRIAKKKKWAELVQTYRPRDPLVQVLLDSHKAAVKDPANELVHLYEICDALGKHFGDRRAAQTALAVSRSRWSRLGQLANGEPIKQGRHRGKNLGALRDATEDELKQAHSIARDLVWGYLQYLENQDSEAS